MASNQYGNSGAKVPGYLTFDDGPFPVTVNILDILAEYHIPATFYLTYKNLAKHPRPQFDIVRRILNDGHAIGNHGIDHHPQNADQYKASTVEAVRLDFVNNHDKFAQLFAQHGASFPGFSSARLPGDGRFQPKFKAMIPKALGLPHVDWHNEFSYNGRFGHLRFTNWQGIYGVAGAYQGLSNKHDIILLHDEHWTGRLDKFRKLIERLNQTFRFRSLDPVPAGHPKILMPS